MLALEAHRLGYNTCVLDPSPGCPAGQVSTRQIVAGYDDMGAMAELARVASVITYEFENVDLTTVAAAERVVPVYPSSRVLGVVQNRVREKSTLAGHGIPVTGFRAVRRWDDLQAAVAELGFPVILKTASYGYDGKGQVLIKDASRLEAAYQQLLESGELICEAFVPFELELSVICARSVDGRVACFDPAHNVHKNGILDTTVFPAAIDLDTAQRAKNLAAQVAEALDVVGLLAVEMFLKPDGALLINEIAPRPHNSGHITVEACPVSQFEQLLRVLCRLPLGDTTPYGPGAMANLLGDLWQQAGDGGPDFGRILELPGVRLHLYGKSEARPGRKMGHISALAPTPQQALELVLQARDRLVK